MKPIKQKDVESLVRELFKKYPNNNKNDGYLAGEIFCSNLSFYTKNTFQLDTENEFVTIKTHQEYLVIEYQNLKNRNNWERTYMFSKELIEFIVKETMNRLKKNLKSNLNFLKSKI